jgi:hypothetical protein
MAIAVLEPTLPVWLIETIDPPVSRLSDVISKIRKSDIPPVGNILRNDFLMWQKSVGHLVWPNKKWYTDT